MVSSFELAWDKRVGVVDECCDSAIDAIEFNLSRRQGGGSLPCNLSLPLPLEVLPPGVMVLLLLLLCRNRTGSNFVLLETSASQRWDVSYTVMPTCDGFNAIWLQTLSTFGLLFLELVEILHILPIVGRFLVFHQVTVVLLLIGICLAFVCLLFACIQVLPILSDEFCNFCERGILAF